MPIARRGELPDDEYPLLLTTDRSLRHFHTGSMTRKSGMELSDGEELLNVHSQDASARGLVDGDLLRVACRRGQMTVRALVTDVCPVGVVFSAFHFAESPVNQLTNAARDPAPKTPETKVCAARIEKAQAAAARGKTVRL